MGRVWERTLHGRVTELSSMSDTLSKLVLSEFSLNPSAHIREPWPAPLRLVAPLQTLLASLGEEAGNSVWFPAQPFAFLLSLQLTNWSEEFG